MFTFVNLTPKVCSFSNEIDFVDCEVFFLKLFYSLRVADTVSSSSVSVAVSQASTKTAKATTMIQTPKSSINHRVVHSLLIVIVELELFFSNSQALQCLVLDAILLE